MIACWIFEMRSLAAVALFVGLCAAPSPTLAQTQPVSGSSPADGSAPLVLTLDRAVKMALQSNFDLQGAELDVREASAQVREVRGQVLPQVNFNGSYTRNVVTANPFAGGDLSSIFGGGDRPTGSRSTSGVGKTATRPPGRSRSTSSSSGRPTASPPRASACNRAATRSTSTMSFWGA
jgi:outer membrane protein TolC